MAISVFKTFSAGEVLTASDLNSSLTQIINNAADLISPFTKNIAAGSFKITGLAAGSAAGDSVRFEQIESNMPLNVCEFRLTGVTGTQVTTSDVLGATSLFWTPYKGNRVALYDGANWNMRTSAELSIAAAGLTNLGVYDIFVYDNAGTPTLESLIWTNTTTRATGLTLQNGVPVKTGAATRRYLGTIQVGSGGNFYDAMAFRSIWNYYNRVRRPMRVVDATDTWNYTTATIRQANASTANQLDFVIGVSEDLVSAEIIGRAANSTVTVVAVGIGLDSTTTFTTGGVFNSPSTDTSGAGLALTASLKVFPGVGRHFL